MSDPFLCVGIRRISLYKRKLIMTFRLLPALAALLFAASAHSHSFDVGSLHIDHPYARPTVAQQPSGAAFLSIENRGKTADKLVRASAPVAKEVQIHSMKMEGDVMRMRELDALEVNPAATVTLQPGGYHIMLIGLKQPLKTGDKFPLMLTFEKAGQVEVTVVVEERSKGAPAPAMQHKH